MNTTQQVKKTSHHIQKEVNHMKKSSVHRINGPILENIFKKGIDIQIYNEENLSKLAIVPIETREKNQYSSVVNDIPPTLSRSNNLTTQTSNTNIINSNNIQETQRNTDQTSYKPPVQRSNTSSNISRNLTKRQETVAGLSIEILEPSKPVTKNANLSNRRTLAKNSSFKIERSETNLQEETINIYKELVTLLEKKCSVLEATSLSQDDKMLKIQNIDKEFKFKKESLSKPFTLKSSERTENTELYEVRKNVSNDKKDESLFDKVYNEVEDSSDDDDLIYDIEKEIQRKEALAAQRKKQERQKSEKITDNNTNNNDFDDYMDQEFDDFNNNGKIADPIHSDASIIADSRDHISLSKLQSNKSDITDEAEIEDSHYFSSGQEYSRHQSDIDFVAGGDSLNDRGDESYNPGPDSSSEISDIVSTQQKLRKNSDDFVILDKASKIDVKDEPLELINFDDSFDNEVENLPHVILSDEYEGEVIELSSDYDAERETNAYNENIDSIDQDFEIICSQPSKINNPTKKLALQDKYNFKSEKLTEDEDSDDELQALVFNQIDRSKSLTTTQTRIRPAGENRHPWSDELEDNLQSKFNLNSFRSNQLDAINATLKGQDVFVLMPTGGGKSLCYQLPATVKQGRSQTTLVISPLISLMQDQVDHLRALRINAAMISSKDSAASRRESFQMFRDGALDLIYLSPEMINKSTQCRNTIKRLYENDKLARIVIDEAHCVSSWGHDFRPDYKQLNFFKKEYPDIPMMALTATASMKVRTDILNNLGLNNAVLFKQSFNRPNLVYMVRPKNKNSMFEMITEIKNRFFYNTGIVYCNSKKQCEDTSKLLEANGLSCSFYHAGMLNEDRSEVQIKWQSGEIKIVCATVAFGMGIDKPDVRFVYHHTMPRSLEGYYQECGRAGRDGKTAFCAMYYQYADFKSLESQIKKDKSLTNEELKQRHLEKLHEVLNYCSNTIECRRKLVLQYFNENFDVKLCKKTCDNCKASNIVEHKDITEDATYLLNIVEKIGLEDLTSNYIIDVYRGSRQQKIVNNGHALLEEHGKGSKYLKEDVQRMIQLLLDKGYLREKIGTNGFGFTNTYVKFNKKLRSQLTMTFSASKSPSSTPTASRPSSLVPYGGASSRRTGTSMRMINDVLSKNVDINQEGLKEFQQKKKALIKTQQKSNGRKRQSNRGYKRSRRRI